MGADYTPIVTPINIEGYNGLSPFKFWCQKVLPLVYDNSLSYYELLCKVVDYLNKVIEDLKTTEDNIETITDTTNDNIEAVIEAYEELQGYVNAYFENLDVQEEIDAKLDQMAESGALSNLLAPLIPNLVTTWLTANVNPVGSAVVVDASLTIAGAAADAKVTGQIRDKQNVIYNGYQVSISGETVTTDLYISSGEEIKITVSNKSGGNITAFIDGDSSHVVGLTRNGVFYFTVQTSGYLKIFAASNTSTADLDITFVTQILDDIDTIKADVDILDLSVAALDGQVFASDDIACEQGSLNTTYGTEYASENHVRTAFLEREYLSLAFNTQKRGRVFAYNTTDDSFVGIWNGTEFVATATGNIYFESPIDMSTLNTIGDYKFRLVFTNQPMGTPITPSEINLTGSYSRITDEKVETEVYTVGSGKDFTSFTEMLIALEDNINNKIVYVDSGVYDIFEEMGGAAYIASIVVSPNPPNWRTVCHIVPPNTKIVGVGDVTLTWNPTDAQIISGTHANLFSPLNLSGSCEIENIKIVCSNCRYAIHDEQSNIRTYDGAVHILKNVTAIQNPATYNTMLAYGAGHNQNTKYYFKDCVFSAPSVSEYNNGISFSTHNGTKTSQYNNSLIVLDNCICKSSTDGTLNGLRLQHTVSQINSIDNVNINGCAFGRLVLSEGSTITTDIPQAYKVTTTLCNPYTLVYGEHIDVASRIAPDDYLVIPSTI